MTKEEIGNVIRESRNAAGLTQLQVANALDRPQNTISAWEMGRAQPDANTLFELFQVLGRSVDEAFGFAKYTPPLSAEALQVAQDYDNLDEEMKDATRYIIEHLLMSRRPLSENIKFCRERRNLSQQELSEKSGIPVERLKYLESKESILFPRKYANKCEVDRLAIAMNVNPDDFQGITPTLGWAMDHHLIPEDTEAKQQTEEDR